MKQFEPSNSATKETKVPYITLLGVLIIVVLFCVLWRPLNPNRVVYMPLTQESGVTELDNPVVGNAKIEIINDRPDDGSLVNESSDQPEDEIIEDEIDQAIDQNDGFIHYTVGKGDTLHGIMMQYGVNRNDVYSLTSQYKQLANLRIGQQISWSVDAEHNLLSFNWVISNNNTRIYERVDGKFTERVETREGEWKQFNVSGEIDSSFIADAKNLGLTRNEIATITKALQWQFDFRRLRKGDQFSVLLSREMLDDKHENSQLLGVRIKNGSKDYYAILAEDGRYYDMNGGGLSQGFLRYPLAKQARISSNFNPRRLHPVTHKIAPHNGVDFAVSRGTPVLSVGDGEVVIAKYSGSAGNYIAIRHGRQYTTKYMHLDKILVKPGQQVKRGDKIGLSGNTGRSTGPHLHYELHIDGKPVNPLTANLPVSGGLTGKSKTTFLEQFKEIKPKLEFSSEKADATSNATP